MLHLARTGSYVLCTGRDCDHLKCGLAGRVPLCIYDKTRAGCGRCRRTFLRDRAAKMSSSDQPGFATPARIGSLSTADPKARDRRVVTVLFADIVDSTALIENADAETARDMLDPVVALMTACVRRFGGAILQRAGDG